MKVLGVTVLLAVLALQHVNASNPSSGNASHRSHIESEEMEKNLAGLGLCSWVGDPHFLSFDNQRFDMYALGDFLVVKTADDRLRVQTKTGLITCCGTNSANKRIAMKIDNDVLVLREDHSTYVNGQPVNLPSGGSYVPASKSFTIRRNGNRKEIVTVNGNFVYVDNEFSNSPKDQYMNVWVHLIPEYRGKTSGMCGNWNGNAADDVVGINGVGVGGKTFAVSGADDLFEKKDAFVPAKSAPTITPAMRKEATAFCSKLGLTANLENCIIDYAIGGAKMAGQYKDVKEVAAIVELLETVTKPVNPPFVNDTVNLYNGKNLLYFNGAAKDGAPLLFGAKTPNAAKTQFVLKPVKGLDGHFRLISRANRSLSVGVLKADTKDGAQFVLTTRSAKEDKNVGLSKQFSFHKSVDGTFYLTVRHSAACLSIKKGSAAQEECHIQPKFKFTVSKTANPFVNICEPKECEIYRTMHKKALERVSMEPLSSSTHCFDFGECSKKSCSKNYGKNVAGRTPNWKLKLPLECDSSQYPNAFLEAVGLK